MGAYRILSDWPCRIKLDYIGCFRGMDEKLQ